MSRRYPRALLLAALVLAIGGLSWWALPRIIGMIPGHYQQRLPRPLLRLVTTPLPTALPAPVINVVEPRITVPVFASAVPSATATLEPSATATPAPTTSQEPGTAIPATWTAIPTATTQPSPTSTPTPTAIPTSTPLPASFQLDGLQNIPQKFNNCGPANLSVNLSFYDHPVPQLDIAAALKPREADRNVSPDELARFVNEETALRAVHLSGGSLTLLKRLVLAGFPVIIEKGLTPNEWEGWMGHYLTIYGYDDAVEAFYSIDTYLGPWDGSGRVDSYGEIERQWSHFNYTFLLVFPPEKAALVDRLLGPDLTDPVAMWRQAAVIAQAETETGPENPFAWFNLGTNLTHLAQLLDQAELHSSAAAAFDRARQIGLPGRMLWYQFEPYTAYLAAGRIDEVILLTDATLAYPGGRDVEETYLYRGHALLAMDDVAGARAAYQRALQLNPHFRLAQQALDALP